MQGPILTKIIMLVLLLITVFSLGAALKALVTDQDRGAGLLKALTWRIALSVIAFMFLLLGFYLGWKGGLGKGRALGSGKVKFAGQVLPTAKKITYFIDLKRVIMRKLVMGIADATMKVDGRVIYQANDLKVGLFTRTDNF